MPEESEDKAKEYVSNTPQLFPIAWGPLSWPLSWLLITIIIPAYNMKNKNNSLYIPGQRDVYISG